MRHERIVLVMLGYMIGFITAYIAFGVTVDQYDKKSHRDYRHVDSSYLGTEVSGYQKYHKPASLQPEITFTDDGMFVTVGTEERIISGTLNDSVEPGPGFHVAVPYFAVALSGKYVYYCEQQYEETDACVDYVYSIAEHETHAVKVNGERFSSTALNAEVFWQGGRLVVGDEFTSRSIETPWLLAPFETN